MKVVLLRQLLQAQSIGKPGALEQLLQKWQHLQKPLYCSEEQRLKCTNLIVKVHLFREETMSI